MNKRVQKYEIQSNVLLPNADKQKRGSIMALTLGNEDKRKEAMELFIRALQAAPDSFIKALSGKNYAKELIDGASEFKEYLFPSGEGKK
jgi:hypothetical protein